MQLNADEGDTSSFVTNGEWSLLGKNTYNLFSFRTSIFMSLCFKYEASSVHSGRIKDLAQQTSIFPSFLQFAPRES